jgi:carbamoyl-phosphate synthase large subunit
MPRRNDISKIFIIGSGPIVIGQACEFDYSGTQACRALREEGYRIILVNSNPATIMTDPEFADRTYVEPLTVSTVAKIIEKERPDVLLPTVGGQTALNLAVKLAESGILREYGVRLIGARLDTIKTAEDRRLFRTAMESIGLDVPKSATASTVRDALDIVKDIGYPAIIRPSFTLGGAGSGIAYNRQEFEEQVRYGIDTSPIHEVLIEESVLGWKEYELEVMRDCRDNVVIVCTIENVDPMGVHTGDSITVAPAQTLSDVEFQRLRDMSAAVMRRIGVETGGSNVQFAVHPRTGRTVVIEMNPRVSRSSALASKATGFPIARIAAKLAVGYSLDELPNEITGKTMACFEPVQDYCVVKVPRWVFEKFPAAQDRLGTQMTSVGETMAIGRTFRESIQKALRSLETGRFGLGADNSDRNMPQDMSRALRTANSQRIFQLRQALQSGMAEETVSRLTGIDPWFVNQLAEITRLEGRLRAFRLEEIPGQLLKQAKRNGFSDRQIAVLTGSAEEDVRMRRERDGLIPSFKTVDTCSAEFEARTPYFYSCYDDENETSKSGRPSVIVLGGGPNRIGQGIEFDYCCVHAVLAMKSLGYDTIMINNNPSTVSTDFDIPSKLYIEPLTLEHVLEVVRLEKPEGVLVQFGGQTPLKLARALQAAGVPIAGTSPESIDLAEDRERFGALLRKLDIPCPDFGAARTVEEAREIAGRIGYPVLVRPSYVLGGRAMVVVYNPQDLEQRMQEAVGVAPEHPVLIDRYLEDSFEVDVDAVCDGEDVLIGGIMQHIEEAGIHSGDSACVLPSYLIREEDKETMRACTRRLALALNVKGLINIQYAIKDGKVYVLEVNPRASRTVPFVSKATGVPLAKVAAMCAVGRKLKDMDLNVGELRPNGYFVKESVFPFDRFPGVDTVLGPEMRSTGEVMGHANSFGVAFAKSQQGTGQALPSRGSVFISVNDFDKRAVVPIAGELAEMGFKLHASAGTGAVLAASGIRTEQVFKVNEGRPNIVDFIKNGEIDIVINTPFGRESFHDEKAMRRAAFENNVLTITTLSGARAAVEAVRSIRSENTDVRSLQDVYSAAK